jgi:DsbC/DsbD-like thiol-disulfide interchange protein
MMERGMKRIGAMILGLVALLSAQAFAAESDVEARVYADVTAIHAGQPFTVAVVLTPQAGWHIYWKNPGDSGLPTVIQAEVPAGFVAGEMRYPIPTRITVPGDIVNYGYEGPTVFLVPITPPRELAAGTRFDLQLKVSWLCCKEECVPGGTTLKMGLPVGESAAANAALFSNARAMMPEVAVPQDAVASIKQENGPGLRIEWTNAPAHVDVFPLTVDGLEVSDIGAKTTGTATAITLHAHVLSGQTLKVERLPVLISFRESGGRTRGFFTDIDLRALSAHVSR